jgi:hypothetical protein
MRIPNSRTSSPVLRLGGQRSDTVEKSSSRECDEGAPVERSSPISDSEEPLGGPCGIRTHDSRIKSQSLCGGALNSARRFEFRRFDRPARLNSCRVQCSGSKALRSTGFDLAIVRAPCRYFNGGRRLESRPGDGGPGLPLAGLPDTDRILAVRWQNSIRICGASPTLCLGDRSSIQSLARSRDVYITGLQTSSRGMGNRRAS